MSLLLVAIAPTSPSGFHGLGDIDLMVVSLFVLGPWTQLLF